jgi:pilus assembly protein FimV
MRVGALAAPAGLAVAAALITACAAGQATMSPAASHGAGSNGAGGNGSPGSGAATPVASHSAASSAAASPSATAASGAGPSASASSGRLADCAPWPAGSTGTTLDVDAGGNGHIYCVAMGDTVRVQLSGSELSTWKPLRLSGGALVPVAEPARPALMPAFPLRSYRAVRPGDAMLYASRSCRAVQPQAAAVPQPTTAVMAYFGGTPISPGCVAPDESFRVTIVVS